MKAKYQPMYTGSHKFLSRWFGPGDCPLHVLSSQIPDSLHLQAVEIPWNNLFFYISSWNFNDLISSRLYLRNFRIWHNDGDAQIWQLLGPYFSGRKRIDIRNYFTDDFREILNFKGLGTDNRPRSNSCQAVFQFRSLVSGVQRHLKQKKVYQDFCENPNFNFVN